MAYKKKSRVIYLLFRLLAFENAMDLPSLSSTEKKVQYAKMCFFIGPIRANCDLAPVKFPALSVASTTSWLQDFPHLSALAAGYMFSRACSRLPVFRAFRQLHVFPPLPPVKCFTALAAGYKFSRPCRSLLVSAVVIATGSERGGRDTRDGISPIRRE